MIARGFTLVELVVALGVATLMLATVPASLSRAHEAMEYRTTVREILASLKSARLAAMQSGTPAAFVLDTGERRFGADDAPTRGIPERLKVAMILADTELDADTSGRIRFYPDGSATGGAIDIVRPSGSGVRLTVDWLLGRVGQTPIEAALR